MAENESGPYCRKCWGAFDYCECPANEAKERAGKAEARAAALQAELDTLKEGVRLSGLSLFDALAERDAALARAAAAEERERAEHKLADDYLLRMDAALRERDEARAIARGRLHALLNYGRHHSDCAQPARGLRCSCGLDGWLKEGPADKR